MPDLEKVLKALEHHKLSAVCNGCPYEGDDDTPKGYCPVYDDAIALLDTMHRAWETVKFTVNETAQNNAGENEDVYKILMFVARLMDNQERWWRDG